MDDATVSLLILGVIGLAVALVALIWARFAHVRDAAEGPPSPD